MSIVLYSHFHKSFPFNKESTWVKPVFTGGLQAYTSVPPDNHIPYFNVNNGNDTINNFKHYYTKASENDFLRAMGQQATEYWMLRHTPDEEYMGCTTYRRYLLLNDESRKDVAKIVMPASAENLALLTDDKAKEIALRLLQSADVITNHSIALPHSVEAQYLQSQPIEYWNLFKEAIHNLYPSYRQHLTWFTDNNIINYETCYIMRRENYLKYADELFRILEYIWKNCSEVYPTKQTTSEPLPWRYPGFLGERFFPFFVYANHLRKIQVPLVLLE